MPILDLGYSLEELMFPENYHEYYLYKLSPSLVNHVPVSPQPSFSFEGMNSNYETRTLFHGQKIENLEWQSSKQTKHDATSDDNTAAVSSQLANFLAGCNSCYTSQVKSLESNETITAFLFPSLSIKVSHDSWPSDLPLTILPLNVEQRSLNSNHQLPPSSTSTKHSSSTNNANRTKSSISTSSSTSNDHLSVSPCSSQTSFQDISTHKSKDDCETNSNRRRRKRTIFTSADIESLKEAFILNPKPSQQDILALSELLGHDAYVIRVWFYNKRQATKKRSSTSLAGSSIVDDNLTFDL